MAIFTKPLANSTTELSAFATCVAQAPELLADFSPQDEARIAQIFVHNLQSGRAHRVRGRWTATDSDQSQSAPDPAGAPEASAINDWQLAYLRQVVQIYRQERERLLALARSDNEAWHALFIHLVGSAYNLLLKHGFSAHQALDTASDIAQQACCKIYTNVFPCDVAFDIWAHVILKNCVLHKLTRSKELLDRQRHIESFEQYQTDHGDRQAFALTDPACGIPQESAPPYAKQIEDRDWLAQAIDQLPSIDRRIVIIYTFFYGLSDDEIAQKMEKSKGAIHTLRHRALKQLQSMLDPAYV